MRRGNAFDRLRPLRRFAGPIEAVQVQRFGRSILSVVFKTPVVVLHTTGRRSGRERKVTLAVHVDADGSLFVVGGAGGQTRVPDWVANLRTTPTAAVTLRRERFHVQATELTGAERTTAWSTLVEVWPQIASYERRAGRDVPVFKLTRCR